MRACACSPIEPGTESEELGLESVIIFFKFFFLGGG